MRETGLLLAETGERAVAAQCVQIIDLIGLGVSGFGVKILIPKDDAGRY